MDEELKLVCLEKAVRLYGGTFGAPGIANKIMEDAKAFYDFVKGIDKIQSDGRLSRLQAMAKELHDFAGHTQSHPSCMTVKYEDGTSVRVERGARLGECAA
jgi:hypothetical protein